jgi:DNA-binding FadR family transcriptional regulator
MSHALAGEARPWHELGGQRYRTVVTSDMIARNYDESFAVALIDATRGGPNNLYRVIRASLCALLKADSNALTLSAIASHPVNLHLLLADGSRNPAITYAIRPLVHVMTHPPTLRPASQIM